MFSPDSQVRFPSILLLHAIHKLLLCYLLFGNPPLTAQATDVAADFVEHHFEYLAPEAGKVYLGWRPYGRPLDSAATWTAGTRVAENILLTPTERRGDTFAATLRVPRGLKTWYGFWTLKTRTGELYDFWDEQAAGIFKVDTGTTVRKARPPAEDPWWNIGFPAFGPYLFLGLLGVYLLWRWRGTDARPHGNVFSLGAALAILHLPLRAAILGLSVAELLDHPRRLGRLLAASAEDLLLVLGFTLVAYLLTRPPGSRRYTYPVLVAVAAALLFAACANVLVVEQLGAPITYAWLYYADFLVGNAAWSAISSTTGTGRVVELAGYVASLPLSAWLIGWLGGATLGEKFAPWVWGGGLLLVTLLANNLRPLPGTGQTDNAILHFVASAELNGEAADRWRATGDEVFTPPVLTRQSVPIPGVDTTGVIENVVFVVLESAGAAYFDHYGGGHKLTPNLNAAAARSLIFERAYATSPASNCSLVSLLSGVYPYVSYRRITQEAPDIPLPGLAGLLKARDYRTSFFSSADFDWQRCLDYLRARRFDVVEDYRAVPCDEDFQMAGDNYKESGAIADACLADRLDGWLDEGDGRPFFSVLWTVQGHYPYYLSGPEVDYGVGGVMHNRYLNTVREADELVGDVLGRLRERGLDSTTLVVVVGDHGEAFGQHGTRGHANTLYEVDVRVPLYFINPVLFKGERETDLTTLADVPATVASLLDLPPPPEWSGRDVLKTDSRELFLFAHWTKKYHGYRRGDIKYIFNDTDQSVAVYDLGQDPGEQHDISDSYPADSISAARSRIRSWAVQHNQLIERAKQHP